MAKVKYVASRKVVADCGGENKTFDPGEALENVSPDTLESMVRVGWAMPAGDYVEPQQPVRPVALETGDSDG